MLLQNPDCSDSFGCCIEKEAGTRGETLPGRTGVDPDESANTEVFFKLSECGGGILRTTPP